jgi:hypothetical protein
MHATHAMIDPKPFAYIEHLVAVQEAKVWLRLGV